MIRQAVRGLIVLAALTLFVEATLGQQNPGRVYYRKDGAVKDVPGEVKFGPTGFQIVGADKKAIALNFADFVKVTPGDLPGTDMAQIRSLMTTEEKKTKEDYETAKLGYQNLRQKALNAPPQTQRYLAYKLALTTTRIADETTDEKWAGIAAEAAKAWTGFVDEFKGSWEVWPAARHGARLYAELNKFEDAARIWNRLAKADSGLPPDLRLEASIQEIDAQLRSGVKAAYSVAQVAAAGALKAAPEGQAKERLAVYDIAAKSIGNDPPAGIKLLEEKVAATKDRAVLAVVHSMLGELYMEAKRPRDAMWSFLWVETVYNSDPEEVHKAVCRLVEVFRAQGDEDRAKAYLEKARRLRPEY